MCEYRNRYILFVLYMLGVYGLFFLLFGSPTRVILLLYYIFGERYAAARV